MNNEKNNTKDREIIVSRTFNAPVDLVWEMWSQPEHIIHWWGPTGFTSTISVMDFTPGGKWDFIMHGPDGTDYDNKNIFTEIVKHEKIAFEHVSDPKSATTVEFVAQGEKTLLTWHMIFESAEQFIEVVKKYGAIEGLKQNAEKLEIYLAALAEKSSHIIIK